MFNTTNETCSSSSCIFISDTNTVRTVFQRNKVELYVPLKKKKCQCNFKGMKVYTNEAPKWDEKVPDLQFIQCDHCRHLATPYH